MDITYDVAAIISAIVWPLIIVIVLLAYRKNILAILPYVKKVSFAGLTIELAEVKAFSPRWSMGSIDVRQMKGVDIDKSYVQYFIDQLTGTTTADYAVIDLGKGDKWLSSRLFILAILLGRMIGLKSFVFVETMPNLRRKYIGWAEPSKIRWAFAIEFPWMEEAFGKAYGNLPEIQIVSKTGKLGSRFNSDDPFQAINLLQNFVFENNKDPPPLINDNEWVSIGPEGPEQYLEHAQWLNGDSIEDLLEKDLNKSYLVSSKLKDMSESDQIRQMLLQSGRYVAITRDDMRFEKLIDRYILLEKVSKSLLREK